jgi:hypothetical protein
MEASNKFYRSFLIFSQEDMGFGANGTPSGYVKIEAREGKGKLNASVQNLKENNYGSNYKVYILKCTENYIYPVYAGIIPCQKNRGELQWEFNPRNVGDSGIAIQDFNVAAVIVENNKASGNLICPLAAYKDKKLEWKDKMKVLQSNTQAKNEEETGDIIKKQEVYSNYDNQLQSKYTKPDYVQNTNPIYTQQNYISNEYIEPEEEMLDNMITAPESTGAAPELEETTGLGDNSNIFANTENNFDTGEIPLQKNDYKMDPELQVPGFSNGHVNIDEMNAQNPVQEQMAYIPAQEQILQNPGVCSYMNSPYCNPQMNGNMPFGCANCTMKAMKNEEPPKEKIPIDRTAAANMEKFHKSLDSYFEVSDPFRSNRRDYKWWKVNSPVQLNNIFYQCNIKTPLFFNPSVMMAHYKYRHLIVGMYSDKTRRREYIVCGIPGVYGIDDRPFGDMCRWVQVEGNKPKYGAFGYWLVYIDPKTGKFLELN